MAEEESENHEAMSGGRMPPIPKPARETVTIDGKASELRDDAPGATTAEASARKPASATADTFAPPPQPKPARAAPAFGWGFAGGLIGGLIGAGLAVGAFWVYGPWEGPLSDMSSRLGEVSTRQNALEAADAARNTAAKAIETRLAALESFAAGAAKASAVDVLEGRLARVESSEIKPDALAATAMDAQSARDEAKKALALAIASAAVPPPAPGSATPPPDPRVTKLVADTSVIADRVARLEATYSAPKSEMRVAAAEPPPRDDSASKAIAAIALEQLMRAGEPFSAEFAALSRLGAEAARLGVLKPFADSGVPTAAALGAEFGKVAPAMLRAVNPDSGGGTVDRMLDHVTKLVRVHAVGEVAGEDPDALVSQIAAALSRGQVEAALKTFARLPEPARKAAGDWPAKAQARVNAEAAARALRDDAIAGLAAPKN